MGCYRRLREHPDFFGVMVSKRSLSEFASRLHEICQTEPVTFFPKPGQKGYRIEVVELFNEGLNLILTGHDPYRKGTDLMREEFA